MKCENCRFFQGQLPGSYNDQYGTCHRRPPVVVLRWGDFGAYDKLPTRNAQWPIVLMTDWCGEMEATP